MTHIVVVGPGGIGGTVAALLARTGQCKITLLGRPGAHVEAIPSSGLKFTGAEEFTVAVEVVDDPAALRVPPVWSPKYDHTIGPPIGERSEGI